jgi:hypothetical protein
MRVKGALALAAAVASAAPVLGCGSDKDKEFIDGYNRATRPLQKLNADVGGALSDTKDRKAASDQFDELADTAQKVNGDLGRLDPPDDANSDFEALKASLRGFEGDLRNFASAADSGNLKRITTAANALAKDGDAISKSEDAVKKEVEG